MNVLRMRANKCWLNEFDIFLITYIKSVHNSNYIKINNVLIYVSRLLVHLLIFCLILGYWTLLLHIIPTISFFIPSFWHSCSIPWISYQLFVLFLWTTALLLIYYEHFHSTQPFFFHFSIIIQMILSATHFF